jgi:hypothetical protein
VQFACRRIGRAETRQMQRRAVAVFRVGALRLREGRTRAVTITERRARLAERKPGRGETGREFHCLRVEVSRRRKIAVHRIVARERIAPVGQHVAGGDENRNGHVCLGLAFAPI